MELLILILIAAGALSGGVWWARRTFDDDGDAFRVESLAARIRHLVVERRRLQAGFLAMAGLNVVLLGVTGLITVSDHRDSPTTWLLIAGVLFGALPAAALLGIGHSIPGLVTRPRIPAHLQSSGPGLGLDGRQGDTDDGGAVDRKVPLVVAMAVGTASLVGSALFALQHMMEATHFLGFTTPVFGISPAVLVPACIEFFQAFLLGAIVVKEIDLANLRGQAASVRHAELEFDIGQQRLESDLTSRRLAADADHAEARAQAGARQREIEQRSAIEEAKRNAAAASLVETARRQAAADLELEDQERGAMLEIRRADIEGRVAEAEGELEIRRAQIGHELAAKQSQAEANAVRLQAAAELECRKAEAEGQIAAAKAEAEMRQLLAAAELEVARAEGEAELARHRAAAELERSRARLELEIQIEQLHLDRQLAEERQQVAALQAQLERTATIDLSPTNGDGPAPKALNGPIVTSDTAAGGNGAKR